MTVTAEWEYGQRYDEEGNFNPRLIACDDCGDYREPDQISKGGNCSDCDEPIDSADSLKYYYLVCYNVDTGEWSIDNSSFHVPESPVYDPAIKRWRSIRGDEETQDRERMKQLRKLLIGLEDV
jgi:hypothetical protein